MIAFYPDSKNLEIKLFSEPQVVGVIEVMVDVALESGDRASVIDQIL